ncbi:MAG TPA: hypothetical protein VD997_15215 [Phycisphaerales bacterium]|nr:hypothetical protein [Phycisphaerales bacterium]
MPASVRARHLTCATWLTLAGAVLMILLIIHWSGRGHPHNAPDTQVPIDRRALWYGLGALAFIIAHVTISVAARGGATSR